MGFSSSQVRLFKRLLTLMVVYTVLRVGFYFYHFNLYQQFSFSEILLSFGLGLRFDLAAVVWLNSPLIILSCFNRVSEKVERLLFILINAVGILASIDDYELFLFVGKRLSLDFFVITGDIIDQLPQLLAYYWFLPLLAVVAVLGLYALDKRYFVVRERPQSIWQKLVSCLLILGCSFVAIRGGLQHKSINVQSAFVQGSNELGHLVLNTPYHFLRTLKNRSLEMKKFFSSDQMAKEVILKHRSFDSDFVPRKGSNVVLIILESFSLEYVEEGFAPFLSELSKKSAYFERHLANGRRSIESMPALLCGLPALIEEPISKSVYSGNKFVCMPELLRKAGYSSAFFHGAARGSMGFESYTRSKGFEKYFSREDYTESSDFDGTWGIFDGPFLQFAAKKMDELRPPFLAGIFTLSSHQPYTIPEKYKGKFPKGSLEIHESIGYADNSLKEFFSSIENKPWFKNTLFIITADHTQKLRSKKFSQNYLGAFRVPLILYAPGVELKKSHKVTQHSDIPQTVLEFTGVRDAGLPLTGRSILSRDRGMGINLVGGNAYYYVQDETVLTLDEVQTLASYNWESGELVSQGESSEEILKAYLQYFINALIKNSLSR